MKNMGILLFAASAVALMSGCASPVYVEKDESVNLAKYKTYMWVQTRADQDDNRNATAFAETAIHNAVRDQLSREGWMEVRENPDALLSYDILVERSNQTQSQAVYTQPFTRVYYNPYLRRWGTVYYPSQFVGYDSYDVPVREGTITITMMDARTDKTIWQAWTTDEMQDRRFTTAEINKGVKNIFKKFDPR